MKIWLRVAALFMACASWSAFASPLETSSHNNIVYLADSDSTSVARYSLETQGFLAPITLAQKPIAVHADSSGFYASYGTRIVKAGLDGSGEASFRIVSQTITDIESTDQWLVLAGDRYLQVVNKSNGTLLNSKEMWYTSGEISLSADNDVFVTSSGISPADIYRIPIDAAGQIQNALESPYHGDYGVGQNAQPFPNQHRVVDNSGNVYNTIDLTHAGNLGGSYDAIAFWQGLPVVLRDDKLYSYNSVMLETGSHDVNPGANDLVIYQDDVVLFGRANPANLQVQWVDISAITPADPVAPIDPTNLQYTPDTWVLDSDGDTVYLLNKSMLNIFRWSVSQQAYLASIPLVNAPQQFAYDGQNKRIYLSYGNGAINYIDLNTNQEKVFANLGSTASALVVAGDYLVAKGQTGAWGSLSVYDLSGGRSDYQDWIEPTNFMVWDPVTSGIYFIARWSPSDLKWVGLSESGEWGVRKDSPYHSDYGWVDPIRVSEHGRFIAFGTGRVIDNVNLMELSTWSVDQYKDVAWMHGNLFSLLGVDNNLYSRVDRRKGDFDIDVNASEELLGQPIGLVPLPARNKLLVIHALNGVPQFTFIDAFARDTDGDGVFDTEDLFPADPLETVDLDRDGQGNYSDIDDDGDEVNDAQDAFPLDKNESLDTDRDGQGNNADTDDDGDAVSDLTDLFPLDSTEQTDLDRDGVGDNSDTDRDGDGFPNSADRFPNNPQEALDTDLDGVGNNADTDDDNDGVNDDLDALPTDPTETSDLDRDGLGDNKDLDVDGDGVPNTQDAFPTQISESVDTDGDKLGNNADEDDDNDGVSDYSDLYPLDSTESKDSDNDGLADGKDPDRDGDGWLNELDDLPDNRYEYLDSDKDGLGNNADYDDDNDGIPDYLDTNADDIDGDGISNSKDSDRDGDGVANDVDFSPDDDKEWADTDKDGIGNLTDTDDDNDSVLDSVDYYPLDATKSNLNAIDFLPMARSNNWQFDVNTQLVTLGGDKNIAGQTIRPMNFPGGGRLYFKTLNNQIQFFGVYFPALSTDYGVYSTDILLDKGINLLASGAHSGKGDIVISPTYGKRNLNWSAQVAYMGSESVSVPAGQYNALHSRLNVTASTTIEGVQFQVRYTADYWFAEGVGLVKINESGFEMELVKASVTADASADGGSTGGSGGGTSTPELGGGGGGGGSLGFELFALFALLLLMRREKKLF